MRELVASFAEQGLLADGGAAAVDAPRRPVRLHVEGDDGLAALVAEGLGARADVTHGAVTRRSVDGADVLLTCAGWLPDAHWREVDGWCADAGIPWHMSHAEGTGVVVGPIALPGRPPRYADTRARRLAAAAFPGELADHWRALGSVPALPAVPPAAPAARMAVAALLLADVCAWLDGERPPGAGVQSVVDGRTGSVSRHEVRALPDLLAATS